MIVSAHLILSTVQNETRLLKETNSLINLKLIDKIFILGIGDFGLKNVEELSDNITIYRSKKYHLPKTLINIKIFKIFINYFNFLVYLFFVINNLIRFKPYVISCHNLNLLPLAKWCKYLLKIKLIYEPHELETERTGLKKLVKRFSKWLEKKYICHVDLVITVCDPISNWYISEYGLSNVFTLRNIPYNPSFRQSLNKSNLLREEFKIAKDEIVFIYQGIIDKTRGIIELVNLFNSGDKKKHLVVMGFGPYTDWVKKNLSSNVHYKEAVPIDQIIECTSSADIGLIFIQTELSLSYKFSMPNKFHEYIIAGLPVLVSSNLEYLSDTIIHNKVGWSLSTETGTIERFVQNIRIEDVKELDSNILKYGKSIGWQLEEKFLIDIYSKLYRN